MIRLFAGLLLILVVLPVAGQDSLFPEPVFENGKEGYACYRIPAIVQSPDGRLLAFCEARKTGCDDFGQVDIVMKESRNHGKSWSSLQAIATNGTVKAGNPVPVWDLLDPRYPKGRLFLFYNTASESEWSIRSGRGVTEIWFQTSADLGKSWSKPQNITLQVHHPNQPDYRQEYQDPKDWRTNALGPGHGLQLIHSPYRGRLFIPANHSAGEPQDSFADYHAYGFYSDDHGKTFHQSEEVTDPGSNESIATEWTDGTVILNTRQQTGRQRQRLISISHDGGAHWDTSYYDAYLPDPVCQASTLFFAGEKEKALLLSNPQSVSGRNNLVLKASLDGGAHWTESRVVWSGNAAYSDLVQLNPRDVGILFEQGNQGGIFFTKVSWTWLKEGRNAALLEWIKPAKSAVEDRLSLAAPQINPPNSFFQGRMFLEIKNGLPGNRYYYTEDGSEPDEHAHRYYQPIEVKASTVLKIKAFNDSYLPSPVVTRTYFKSHDLAALEEVSLEEAPSPTYPGQGATTLQDRTLGSNNFGDGSWLGFEGNDCILYFRYNRPVTLSKLTVSCLNAAASWILPAEKIEVYTSADGKRFDFWDEVFPQVSGNDGTVFTTMELTGRKERFLKVVIKNSAVLPEGHPGAGQPAWLFVDEVVVE